MRLNPGLNKFSFTKQKRVFALCPRYKVANLKGNLILLVREMIRKHVFCVFMGRVYMYTEEKTVFLMLFHHFRDFENVEQSSELFNGVAANMFNIDDS